VKLLNKVFRVVTLCIAGGVAVNAQQNSPPPAVQPAPQAQSAPKADCTPTQPKPPTDGQKPFHLHPPAWVQRAINDERAQIENKTGITVPTVSPDDLAKSAQKAQPKPCTPTPVASVPPAGTKQ
jgi:hypothetical protein